MKSNKLPWQFNTLGIVLGFCISFALGILAILMPLLHSKLETTGNIAVFSIFLQILPAIALYGNYQVKHINNDSLGVKKAYNILLIIFCIILGLLIITNIIGIFINFERMI